MGGGAPSDALAVVRAWQARGQACADPVQWAIIEALARRVEPLHGQARQWLLQRLAQRLAAVARRMDPPPDSPAPRRDALAGLSSLVDRLGRLPAASGPAAGSPRAPVVRSSRTPPPGVPAALKSVTAFQGTWSRLRAEQRLRQALAQVPSQAGPLNSSHVVHRALQTLHRLSPVYLDAFIAHVDTLLALDEASGAGSDPPRTAPRRERDARAVKPAARKLRR